MDTATWYPRLQLVLAAMIGAILLAAVVRGHAGAILPAVVAMLVGWGIVRYWFRDSERDFLSVLLLAAFAVRAVLALVLHPMLVTNVRREGERFDTFVGFMFEDDRAFDVVSWALARLWAGMLSQTASSQDYLINNYTLLMGGIYYVLGRDVMGPKLLNCAFGALAAVVVYALARELGDRRAGKFAALLAAFFPSLILWSVLNLKDTLVVLLIAVAMLGGLTFAKRPSITWAIVTILAFAALENLRLYVFFALGWLLWISFFTVNRSPWRQRLAIGIPFALALLSVVYITNESQQLGLRYLSERRLESLASSREYGAREADTGIELEKVPRTEDGYTIQLRTAPKVLPYVLWGPFPWEARGTRQLAVIPEMLAWYAIQALVVAALIGYRRERWRELFLPVAFGGGLVLVFSLIEGNVGTIYRHRAMLLVPAFAVAGLGYVWVSDRWARRRHGLVPRRAEAVA